MKVFEILLVNRKGLGYIPTKKRFFITLPNDEVRQQFILDEEKRSGYDVYAKPVTGETLSLQLFSKIACDVQDDEIHSLNIYTEKERTDERLN